MALTVTGHHVERKHNRNVVKPREYILLQVFKLFQFFHLHFILELS